MPGCSFSKSAEIHNRDWLVTPLLSAISGKSATVRVQLDKHSKYTPIGQFIEGYLAKKPFMFSYNPTHQVVVCYICHSCILPRLTSQERHLRAEPHRLLGNVLKTTVQLLSSYNLRTIEELRAHKPQLEDKCEQIQQLTSYSGSRCLELGCDYATRHPQKRREHCASAHKKKAIGHSEDNPLWEECMLQTYFTSPGRIDYFVVVDNKNDKKLIMLDSATPLKEEEKDLFIKLENDYQDVKGDIEKQATIVQDFGDSRSAWVPWLERTGFPSHLVGLKDKEIKSSS